MRQSKDIYLFAVKVSLKLPKKTMLSASYFQKLVIQLIWRRKIIDNLINILVISQTKIDYHQVVFKLTEFLVHLFISPTSYKVRIFPLSLCKCWNQAQTMFQDYIFKPWHYNIGNFIILEEGNLFPDTRIWTCAIVKGNRFTNKSFLGSFILFSPLITTYIFVSKYFCIIWKSMEGQVVSNVIKCTSLCSAFLLPFLY